MSATVVVAEAWVSETTFGVASFPKSPFASDVSLANESRFVVRTLS